MTPTKEQIDEAIGWFSRVSLTNTLTAQVNGQIIISAYRAKCAEVEELRKALKFYSYGVFGELARQALEGKE